MTDTRFGGGRIDDDNQMPWLEPVEEEREPSGPSFGKLIGLVILGLVLLGAVVGGYSWWSQQGATGGDGELIPAQPGPYKIKPADAGGMEIEGEGDTSFAASAGEEPAGKIDMSAVPEAPVVRAAPKAMPSTKAGEGAAAQDSGSIQLGSFSSEAAASKAWEALADRFAYLEPLNHSILPATVEERTVYRLRASGPGAADICGRLQIAGETCLSLN